MFGKPTGNLLDFGTDKTSSQKKANGKGGSNLFNTGNSSTDDMMISLKGGSSNKSNSRSYDHYEETEVREDSSLLGGASEPAVKKRDFKTDNISSADLEKNRSFFQRFLFDPLKYQAYFDTTTVEV